MPWQEMAPPVPSRPRPAIWSEGKALRGWVWAAAVWPWFRGSSLGCKVPSQHRGLSGSWRSFWRVWTPGTEKSFVRVACAQDNGSQKSTII